MLISATVAAVGLSCGPLIGIVAPDRIERRAFELWNRSRGYVVFRVTMPQAEALVTSVLPPGGEFNGELSDLFGTLCPDRIEVEVFAYARAHPERSPLADETLVSTPFASARVVLLPLQDFGCRADVSMITLDDAITFDVLEVDESAGAIGLDANGHVHRVEGLHAGDPPVPEQGEYFPLVGWVVNLNHLPIPNAEVRLLDLGESVFTDVDGRFEILRPVGSYELEVLIEGIEVTPPARRFSHRSVDEVPIEFLALTETVPEL